MGRKRSKGRNRNVKQLAPSRTRTQRMPDEITTKNTVGSSFRRRRPDKEEPE